MMEGSYPPGVYGWMIDQYEGYRDECCGTCRHWDGNYCTKEWNNMDDDSLDLEKNRMDSDELCDDWEWDESLEMEED